MATKVAFQPDPAFFHQEILDAETYNQRLSKLQIEIDVILSQKPFNNLKVNKSKIHLYELLKRHNEKKSISTDELPRTFFIFLLFFINFIFCVFWL